MGEQAVVEMGDKAKNITSFLTTHTWEARNQTIEKIKTTDNYLQEL